MYPAPAVACVLLTDEVLNQRRYGARPLSYGAAKRKLRRWDSNPQSPGNEPCTPIRQSVMFWWRRGCRSEAFPYGNRTRQPLCGRQTHWPEPMYSEPAVAVFQNAQRRVAKRCLCYGRPYRQRSRRLLTGPFISNKTPAPFTSRSPGIATLGPSCTPSRQSGLFCDLPTKK